MPTDEFGNKYEEYSDAEVWTNNRGDKHTIVRNPEGEKVHLIDNVISTIPAGAACPQCEHQPITAFWDAPSATFSCDNCGYMGLGTRYVED